MSGDVVEDALDRLNLSLAGFFGFELALGKGFVFFDVNAKARLGVCGAKKSSKQEQGANISSQLHSAAN